MKLDRALVAERIIPLLKRVDSFLTCSCREALETRQERAKRLLELDDLIVEKVEALKARGLTSPYLKSFVVARVNPIRFRPKDAPPLSFDDAIDRMKNGLKSLSPTKSEPRISRNQVARRTM